MVPFAVAATGSEGASFGFDGADPHATNSIAAATDTTEPAARSTDAREPSGRLTATPRWPEAMSVEARDHILRHLRLAVTGGFELGQHLEALLYPLVINTIFRARRIQLVRLDGLLLERKHLLLEQ